MALEHGRQREAACVIIGPFDRTNRRNVDESGRRRSTVGRVTRRTSIIKLITSGKTRLARWTFVLYVVVTVHSQLYAVLPLALWTVSGEDTRRYFVNAGHVLSVTRQSASS